jgi:LysM repeat protein
MASLMACQRTPLTPPNPTFGNVRPGTEPPERNALLTDATGVVETRLDAAGEWAPTSPGLTLNQGNQLRTSRDARAVLKLTEGSKIYLGDDTAITFNLLNPFMDSQLTSVALDRGQTYILLNGGALDVETPLGTAVAREAYMSVSYESATQTVSITCLQGTCGFNEIFINEGQKYIQTGTAAVDPQFMSLRDYGEWGLQVPEATAFAPFATEDAVQGSATPPVLNTPTLPLPSLTPTPAESATPTQTAAPDQPTPVSVPPTDTPFVPRRPTNTPFPPAPIMGHHTVQRGETLYCIARVYGVLPAAIAQANGLTSLLVRAGAILRIPEVPWPNISNGPVCAPQFTSKFPGLPYVTDTPQPTETPAPPTDTPTPAPELKVVEVAALCIGNCDNQEPTYRLRIIVTVTGGAEPLIFNPGQIYDEDHPRCEKASGQVTVTSADGQIATGTWVYDDVACTPTP